jgi:molybdate transport system substrate-binding protein
VIRRTGALFANLLLTGAVVACSRGQAATSSVPTAVSTPPPAALTIFAAASLAGALDQVKPAYEASHPGTTLTISTDSSAALETQIEQGAPADVFLSADATNPQKLVDGAFAPGSAVTFARNRLLVIVPHGNPGGITSAADLAKPGTRIIAAGDAVPITTYANQLVANLAKVSGYPTDFAAKYAANIVTKVENVQAIVAQIQLGQGDAAIVYLTDAKAVPLDTYGVPDEANVLATYAGVVVRASNAPVAAQAFLEWLAGPDGQAILATFGFMPPT